MCPSRPLADSEKLPVRTHRSEALKSPGGDGDGESISQEPKKRSNKEKKEKKKDKDKDRKVQFLAKVWEPMNKVHIFIIFEMKRCKHNLYRKYIKCIILIHQSTGYI